jgi:predicted PurR-regulated permease PerM
MAAPEDEHRPRHQVPWRTIVATIAVVLATVMGILALRELGRILGWLATAAFFAMVLTPLVDYLQRRGIRRGLGTVIVFSAFVVVVGGLGYIFIRPIAERAEAFVADLPSFVEDAKDGRGPVGSLVTRYRIDTYIEDNQEDLQQALQDAGASSVQLIRTVFSTVFALVTILVFAFLMILQAPQITATALRIVSPDYRDRVRRIAYDCSTAVSGYVAGNVLISVVAGVATFIVLTLLGVPYSGVLALWVAFADLIPMVGATLGAIPTIALGFLHSVPAGIFMVIFYVVYQQFENHFLQPAVMSRTVNLNPLTVLVSVLVGVELFGVIGALLAIPAAGIVQVVARDLWEEHEARRPPSSSGGPAVTAVDKTAPTAKESA